MLTIETKCYEKDWKLILTKSRLTKVFNRCLMPDSKRVIYINNVKCRRTVEKRAKKLKDKKIIDEYYFVEDYAQEVLNFFGLKKEEFTLGYYYSIQELTGIYLCTTPYLLHFAGDCILDKIQNHSNWIKDGIKLLNSKNDISVVNASWDKTFKEPCNESFYSKGGFYYGMGFSDQCYLIKVEEFRRQIYKYNHNKSSRYPKYGGELFEKRVDSYLRVFNKTRLTSVDCVYNHKNAPDSCLNFLFLRYFNKDF